MICKKIYLNAEHTAYLETYILEKEISYQTDKKWPAIIICPGGGYLVLATKEGEGTAMQFLNQGFSCFVLKYSTYLCDRESLISKQPNKNQNAHYPRQEIELMEAMHIIKSQAKEWSIDENNVFTLGFSAGSHVAGSLAFRWNDPKLLNQLSFMPNGNELKPRGSILSYPMIHGNLRKYMEKTKDCPGNISYQIDLIEECLYGHTYPSEEELYQLDFTNYISKDTSPIFLWHTLADMVVDSTDSTYLIEELQKNNISCEYHLFAKGPHGLACSNEHYAKSKSEIDSDIALWIPLALNWMRYIMLGEN